MTAPFRHIPIMVEPVLALLAPERGGIFVDGTLGGGGHAEAVLSRLPADGRLIGIDRDAAAIGAASRRLAPYGSRFTALKGNFFDMPALLSALGIQAVDGILLDLGVSSYQLDTPARGFSYHEDAPLDMRMDTAAPLTASQVVNQYSQEALRGIIRDYGEERYAARIAGAIVKARQQKPIESTLELAQIVKNAIPAANRREGPHPARRTFQALRIAVNGELDGLDQAIVKAHDLLKPGGRMAVITFHSLEDRIVKKRFRDNENPCICPPEFPVCMCGRKSKGTAITRKPIVPGEEELEYNKRSKSSKLRVFERA